LLKAALTLLLPDSNFKRRCVRHNILTSSIVDVLGQEKALCNVSFAEMLGRLPNLSGFKIADRCLLWPVPKLKIDLSRRNASTQGRNTDFVERYQF
jgi:hypothetical protein